MIQLYMSHAPLADVRLRLPGVIDRLSRITDGTPAEVHPHPGKLPGVKHPREGLDRAMGPRHAQELQTCDTTPAGGGRRASLRSGRSCT